MEKYGMSIAMFAALGMCYVDVMIKHDET